MMRLCSPYSRRPGADHGSLSLAMLLALVGVSLTALMTPVLLRQIKSSREAMNWARALTAAESGLHVALGHIRASNGDIDELPCGPIGGEPDPVGNSRYEVSIDYVNADPAGNVSTGYLASMTGSDAWVDNHRVTCSGTHGTTSTPFYALIRSLGTDEATGSITTVRNRAVWAVHKLATTNANIPGGAIKPWGNDELCLDAGAAPAANTTVTVQSCGGGERQRWAYRSNLTIMLSATESSTELCLEAATPRVAGALVRLQPCGETTKPQQQWAYNHFANFQGTTDGVTLDDYCLNLETPVDANSHLVLGSVADEDCVWTYDSRQSFVPDLTVGAGAAPVAVNGRTQIVNYHQFGRCVDIPGQDAINATYVMAWSCKQAPDGANVGWNQLWTLPTPAGSAVTAAGQIKTTCVNTPQAPSDCVNGVEYCLRSPLSVAAGQFVGPTPCSSGGTGLTWTRHGANATTYEQRFQITDSNGLCLSPLEGSDLVYGGASKLVVRTCNGSSLQKWNAGANTNTGLPLQHVGER